MMNVSINGEMLDIQSQILTEAIQEYGATPPYALAVNGDFVPKSSYADFELKEGDLIDIVSPIFGG